MPKVSIIIPYYNQNEDMLRRCIHSAQAQSETDFEIIIINDGSDRDHTELLNFICRDFPGIRLITQGNAGVSVARNKGLAEAKGDYITFLDADDELQPFFLKEALQIADRENIDHLIGGVREVSSEADRNEENGSLESTVYSENRFDLSEHLIDSLIRYEGGYIGRGPVARLVKRETAIRVPFDQGIKIGEDIIWNLRVLKLCTRVAVVKRTWYLYHVNPESATRKFNPDIVHETADELERITQVVDTDNDRQYLAVCNHVIEELKRIHNCLVWRKEWDADQAAKSSLENELYSKEPWNMIGSDRFFRLADKKGKIKAVLYRNKLLFTVWKLAGGR